MQTIQPKQASTKLENLSGLKASCKNEKYLIIQITTRKLSKQNK